MLGTAGPIESHSIPRYTHLVGTCRTGDDPRPLVVNEFCRTWDVANLFVCDGSVLVTQGSTPYCTWKVIRQCRSPLP